jgi:DNA transformation protein and related proteins
VNSKKHEFKEYILDQLRFLDGVESKQMFGGFGLYCNGIFFGIIAADAGVYFKTDAATIDEYKDKGMKPFKPSAKQTLKNYYEVPPEILEDEQQLTDWALKSLNR